MSLYIDVQVYGGSNIPKDVIPEMVALADRLQISVWASLNGVRTLARPGDDAAALAEAWERESDKPESGHRIASVRPSTP